jgi:hypothetical protein
MRRSLPKEIRTPTETSFMTVHAFHAQAVSPLPLLVPQPDSCSAVRGPHNDIATGGAGTGAELHAARQPPLIRQEN